MIKKRRYELLKLLYIYRKMNKIPSTTDKKGNWSVFIQTIKEQGTWKSELSFYCGTDLYKLYEEDKQKKDWRFKAVKKKRKELVYFGIVKSLNFPVEYPLVLECGTIIKKGYAENFYKSYE